MDPREVALKHLEVLDATTSRLSTEASQFAGRFQFGGIVAVIALLNTDLFVDDYVQIGALGWGVGLLALAALLGISGMYFRFVAERILYSRWEYAHAKHKYDITLYALLLGCSTPELLENLEHPLKEIKEGVAKPFPQIATFPAVAAYLHDHHGRNAAKLDWRRDWLIGMLIVVATILIKALFYIAAGHA